MNVATMLKAFKMGVIFSLMVLLVAGPVSAQSTSGPPGASPLDGLSIARSELAASGFVLGATTTETVVPSALPVTGSSLVVLPAFQTVVPARALNPVEAAANELSASGVPFEVGAPQASSPQALPQTGGTDQVPPFLGPQAPATSATGPDPVMGAIMAPASPVPTAPAELPATGRQQDPYLGLMEQYRQMYGGSSAPAGLPKTGAAAGTTLQELLPEEIIGVTADVPGQAPQSTALAAPAALPETGAAEGTTLQELVPEEIVGVTSDQSAASPAPAQLPETGGGTSISPTAPAQQPSTGQQQDPYLELMPQYRQMYGGH